MQYQTVLRVLIAKEVSKAIKFKDNLGASQEYHDRVKESTEQSWHTGFLHDQNVEAIKAFIGSYIKDASKKGSAGRVDISLETMDCVNYRQIHYRSLWMTKQFQSDDQISYRNYQKTLQSGSCEMVQGDWLNELDRVIRTAVFMGREMGDKDMTSEEFHEIVDSQRVF